MADGHERIVVVDAVDLAESDEDNNERDEHFGSDSDEDEFNGARRLTDTTAAQARRGKDIQGIPWDVLGFTRERYRETRQPRNNENVQRQLEEECLQVTKGGKFYSFQHNTRSVRPTVLHFQLRNLIWATSKHDVYVLHGSSVIHWSPLSRKGTVVLNASGPFAQPILGHVQISTMCVRENLLVVGGFQGEMICKFVDKPGVAHCTKITYDENAITNAIDIYENLSGVIRLMTSNNDSIVRIYDVEKFEVLQKFYFPWPVNHTSVSPDKKSVVVVGDHTDGYLVDSQSGKVIETLKGHLDFSFASAWHPNGHIFATGNQDTSCRLWDIRNLNFSLALLKGRIGAIRSLRFTSDGHFLAMAESADFVHIFNVCRNFEVSQEIDIFGEIAGISSSPDAETLFIGVADRTYGSLLEFNCSHEYTYVDSIF